MSRVAQGAETKAKVVNALEFDVSMQVPSNALEFHRMFLNKGSMNIKHMSKE